MLAILTSHPIQYQAPLWQALAAAGIKFEVWFLTPHAVQASPDREFGKTFAWDLDLLAGYPHRFLAIEEGWQLNRFNGVKLKGSWADEFHSRGVTHLWVEGWRFREFWQAVRIAHGNGIQVWLRGETNDLGRRRGLGALFRRIALAWLFRRVAAFLCIGSANRRFYENSGVSPTKLHPAPYGVDNTRFGKAALDLLPRREQLRARWNIGAGSFVVLFCGKLIAKKRPLDLCAAARLAARQMDRPLHLLFAGDGAMAPEIRAQLEQDQANGTITGFLNQSEIAAAYVASDCLVLPSDTGETWGLVVNESLACGRPAIVSDQCGCAEDLGQPQGGDHVYPCGDIAALARSLAAVAAHSPTAELLAKIVDAHAPQHTVETVRALLVTAAPRLS